MLDWEGNIIEKRNITQILLYGIKVDAMKEASTKGSVVESNTIGNIL